MTRPALSWDDLRLLLAVHREKTFLAAGRALGVAPSTIGRRLEALERALGRPVVHRAPSGVQVDPQALSLVGLAEDLELRLDALERGAAADGLSGTVRVAVSEGLSRPVTRVLAQLQRRTPGLTFELASDHRLADLSRREADVAIRIARSGSSTVVERLVTHAALSLYASRGYVDRRLRGATLSRETAGRHDWVGFERALQRLPSEQWLRRFGATRFVFRTSSFPALQEAVLAGMGIGVLAVQGEVPEGLVRLETPEAPPPVPVYLAWHRDARKLPRVMAVVRALEFELKAATA